MAKDIEFAVRITNKEQVLDEFREIIALAKEAQSVTKIRGPLGKRLLWIEFVMTVWVLIEMLRIWRWW